MLQFAPSTFEVIQHQTERNGPAFAALRAEYPRLEALVELLLRWKSEPSAAFGQRYQLDLISRGTFEIPSLASDGTSRATSSLILGDKTVFYAFDGDRDLLVAASFLAEGFPLAAIVIPSRGVMVNLLDPFWGVRREHLRTLQSLSLQYANGDPADPDPARVTLVTGDANFAHHVWNQLGALENLSFAEGSNGKIDILATHQPLGPFQTLFPERPEWSVEYCPDSYLDQRNGRGRMFVPLGGFRVSQSIRKRLQIYATSRLSREVGATVERIASFRRPTFWLSIRTRNRTATNQTEALFAIGKAVLAEYPTACIILDGHSLPADFDHNPSYDRPATLAIVDADRAVAKDVIARLRESGRIGPNQDVIDLVGCDILDSIAVASLADLYFCHHGTVQHKIGWLTDVPGIVHCNRRTLALAPARWVAQKVEDGIEPLYIDQSLVEDEAPSGGLSGYDEALRVECYRFIDLDRLAALFIENARLVFRRRPQAASLGNVQLSASERNDMIPNGEHHLNGEGSTMSSAERPDATFADFNNADHLSLQRELLRVRNELASAQKAKEVVAAEMVQVCGELYHARRTAESAAAETAQLRDELNRSNADFRRELDRYTAELRTQTLDLAQRDEAFQRQEQELARRSSVAQLLNDELVRRDLEIVELRNELTENRALNSRLQGELHNSSFSTEQLLSALNVQRGAIAELERKRCAQPLSRARRLTNRLRRLLNLIRSIANGRRFAGL